MIILFVIPYNATSSAQMITSNSLVCFRYKDCINIQYLNCSEVIVITISHVHRIELLGISDFYHISFLEFTHKLSVITVHTHAIWITQITFIKETKRLSIYVKDVIHIYCQYTTLIVCCDTVVYTLDPSYKNTSVSMMCIQWLLQ